MTQEPRDTTMTVGEVLDDILGPGRCKQMSAKIQEVGDPYDYKVSAALKELILADKELLKILEVRGILPEYFAYMCAYIFAMMPRT